MLVNVDEMRRALAEASSAAGPPGAEDIDVTRARAALDDLERRVRRMLEPGGGAPP
jgi:hypothetical protein